MQEMRVPSLGWEYPLEEEIVNPLQYSCLGNPMDKGAWQAAGHWGRKRVGHNLVTEELVCRPWGSTPGFPCSLCSRSCSGGTVSDDVTCTYLVLSRLHPAVESSQWGFKFWLLYFLIPQCAFCCFYPLFLLRHAHLSPACSPSLRGSVCDGLLQVALASEDGLALVSAGCPFSCKSRFSLFFVCWVILDCTFVFLFSDSLSCLWILWRM